MGEATRLYPTIAKQKRQKQRLKANNAELAEQLEETENELQQAIDTANWNHQCFKRMLDTVKGLRRALDNFKAKARDLRDHVREVSDSRDRQDADRLAWKRTIHDLHQEGVIPLSAEFILQRQAQHLQDSKAEIQGVRAERRSTPEPKKVDGITVPITVETLSFREKEKPIATQEPEFGGTPSDKLREFTDLWDEQEAQRLAWKQTLRDLYEAGHITLPREEVMAQQEANLAEKREEIQTARAEKRGETEAATEEPEEGSEPAPGA